MFEVCMDAATSLSDHKRVSLYRELAEFCGDVAIAGRFSQMADQIESAAQNHRELALQFA
jgi:hypothetical protein